MTEPKALTSYPKSYFILFENASKRPIILDKFSDEKAAQAMRAKLYKFRTRLRKANHPLIYEADNVEFIIRGSTLICQPSGMELSQALIEAGIPVDVADDQFNSLEAHLRELAEKSNRS